MTQQGFLGTIGWIKSNLMVSSQASEKGYSNENFYPGAPDIPDSESNSKTPLNENLIPDMTSVNSPIGTCFADRTVTELNMTNNRTATDVGTKCWKFFNSDKNAGGRYESEHGTEAAINFGYILDSNQYNNGYFDAGTYTFTTCYARTMDTNLQVSGYVSIQLADGTWLKVGDVPYAYSDLPLTSTMTFTTDKKFKAIKYTKTNPSNYVHSRDYWRYGTQLVRLS